MDRSPLDWYPPEAYGELAQGISEVLITAEQIRRRVLEIGRAISQDFTAGTRFSSVSSRAWCLHGGSTASHHDPGRTRLHGSGELLGRRPQPGHGAPRKGPEPPDYGGEASCSSKIS